MRIKLNTLLASALAMSAGVIAEEYTPRHYQTYFVPAIVFDEKPESSGGGSSWTQAKVSNETFFGCDYRRRARIAASSFGNRRRQRLARQRYR